MTDGPKWLRDITEEHRAQLAQSEVVALRARLEHEELRRRHESADFLFAMLQREVTDAIESFSREYSLELGRSPITVTGGRSMSIERKAAPGGLIEIELRRREMQILCSYSYFERPAYNWSEKRSIALDVDEQGTVSFRNDGKFVSPHEVAGIILERFCRHMTAGFRA